MFHPDSLHGISGPWIEFHNPGDISLSPKREFLETLLKQRTKPWIMHFDTSRKTAEAYTTHTKAHESLLHDPEFTGLAIIHA